VAILRIEINFYEDHDWVDFAKLRGLFK